MGPLLSFFYNLSCQHILPIEPRISSALPKLSCTSSTFLWSVLYFHVLSVKVDIHDLVGLQLCHSISSFRRWIELFSARCSKLGMLLYSYSFLPGLSPVFLGLLNAGDQGTSEVFTLQLYLSCD
ncbi:hypothetical protein AMECASPLE_024005 [Ameca splendens]|uniref:Uncharacterized protein n=1 Tax=Ameca splendens TaxID=208324 RepID=A0ABV0YFB5_9TELE